MAKLKKLSFFSIGAALGLSALAAVPAQAQIVANGGFETGVGNSAPPWGRSLGGGFGSSHPAAGARNAFLRGSEAGIDQVLHLQALQHYVFSASFARFAPTSRNSQASFNLFAQTMNSTGAFNRIFRASPLSPLEAGTGNVPYQRISRAFTAQASLVTLQLLAGGATDGTLIAVDNVSISLAGAPEVDPRSGALPAALALGSLMLMTDRRRAKKA